MHENKSHDEWKTKEKRWFINSCWLLTKISDQCSELLKCSFMLDSFRPLITTPPGGSLMNGTGRQKCLLIKKQTMDLTDFDSYHSVTRFDKRRKVSVENSLKHIWQIDLPHAQGCFLAAEIHRVPCALCLEVGRTAELGHTLAACSLTFSLNPRRGQKQRDEKPSQPHECL